eukprot:CAMPEP_0194563174 /NCGR_PEP_ID=MMETSP0292-20121207/3335_1 /TAXON_ID=39354 /ORGANISM="Heterosigma akashiwo, Strain CCMP2393" /LENGTH=89 /DNA_ID=CAMNT_0039412051 /DNA_START=210 /DNA_END=479 /DNA_ORIENTATION=+
MVYAASVPNTAKRVAATGKPVPPPTATPYARGMIPEGHKSTTIFKIADAVDISPETEARVLPSSGVFPPLPTTKTWLCKDFIATLLDSI